MRSERVALALLAASVLAPCGCEVETEPPDAAPAASPSRIATGPTQPPGGPLVLRPPGSPAEDLKGRPLPDFDLPDLDGARVTRDGLKGKVVLIDFWASWCGPCRKLTPLLQALYKEHAPAGLVVLGANTEERDSQNRPVKTRDHAVDYIRENKLTYPVTYGSDSFQEACNVEVLPTVILVDRSGVVRDVWVGLREGAPEAMVQAVEALVKEKPKEKEAAKEKGATPGGPR